MLGKKCLMTIKMSNFDSKSDFESIFDIFRMANFDPKFDVEEEIELQKVCHQLLRKSLYNNFKS
jgi:hypothetical protein